MNDEMPQCKQKFTVYKKNLDSNSMKSAYNKHKTKSFIELNFYKYTKMIPIRRFMDERNETKKKNQNILNWVSTV